ncbi:MAG: hypothetical protein IKJ60_05505 [Ruminococcus sp.]|nr:hypothetical protein [Ruminococcus sp.]
MTLLTIDASTQPSMTAVVIIAAVVFIVSTVVSSFISYKIKLRNLQRLDENDDEQASVDNEE